MKNKGLAVQQKVPTYTPPTAKLKVEELQPEEKIQVRVSSCAIKLYE